MLCYANDVTHVPEYHNNKQTTTGKRKSSRMKGAFCWLCLCVSCCATKNRNESKLNMLNLYAQVHYTLWNYALVVVAVVVVVVCT